MKKRILGLCIVVTCCLFFSACQQKNNQISNAQDSKYTSSVPESTVSDISSNHVKDEKTADSISDNQNNLELPSGFEAEDLPSVYYEYKGIISPNDFSDHEGMDDISSESIEKIRKLRRNTTKEQLHEIFGTPDYLPPTAIYREAYYLDGDPKHCLVISFVNSEKSDDEYVGVIMLTDKELKNNSCLLLLPR